jgi:hypothetical protein
MPELKAIRRQSVLPRFFFRTSTRLVLLVASSLLGAVSKSEAQTRPGQGPPPWAVVPGEPDTYPFGDAVDVYRAVLDQLYIDGDQHPRIIVLWDTAMRFGNGPCPWESCSNKWHHKSRMDTATVLAFARQSAKRPRIIDFGYKIPIARVSEDEFERLQNDGYGYLAPRPADQINFPEALWAGFRHKYSGAWGYLGLSKVGFNTQHSEALISVFQVCGGSCRSNEIMFLKRFGRNWRVIERVTDYTDGMQAGAISIIAAPPSAIPANPKQLRSTH